MMGGKPSSEVRAAWDAALLKSMSPLRGEVVTYGTAKVYDSEAEMIADIQGRPSPVFPLPGAEVK